MTVFADLTEEERYLWAILQDPSGIDVAEFCWFDADAEGECWRAWPFQWCLTGDTSVLTRDGYFPIRDLVGKAKVLTQGKTLPKWVEADINYFGRAPIFEITLERYGIVKKIGATADHTWFADTNLKRERRIYPEVKTSTLKPDMFLRSTYPRIVSRLKINSNGVVHGLAWGDGTKCKQGVRINLWGEKTECAKYFAEPGKPITNREDVSVEGLQWEMMSYYLKEPVRLDECASYLYSWLAGYFAADGSVSPDGTTQISSVDESSLELVRNVCLRLGIVTGQIADHPIHGRGYSTTSEKDYVLTLRNSDLKEEFFLKSSHRKKWQNRNKEYRPRDWKVVSVIPTNKEEDIFCASVPDTHNFVLDGYILTGNSWWHAPDRLQIDSAGRSVGKSTGIAVRSFSFVFRYPGKELVLTAPEALHLDLITQKIEQRIMSVRLTREMITKKRQIRHRPFEVDFQNGSRILGRIPHRDGSAVKGCVKETCLILTRRGLVEARDVLVGDEVWTHKSHWMPVLEVQKFQDDLFEVSGQGIPGWASEKSGSPGGLMVSGKHRFYGRYNLNTPKQKRRFDSPEWAGLKDLERFYWASPSSFIGEEKIPGDPQIEMTNDFWWILGLYLADGYISSHGNKNKNDIYTHWQVNWIVHPNKRSLLLERLQGLNLNHRVNQRDHSSADRVTINQTAFALWLESNFGKLAGGKELPIWLLFQPEEVRRSLLEGYLYGDGTIEMRSERSRDRSSSSASKKLTLGFKLLAQSLGYSANMTAWQPTVTHIRGIELKNKPQLSWRLGIPERGLGWFDDNHVHTIVRGVRPAGRGNVVNIVTEDHSYVADGIVSHNTHGIVLELDEGQNYPDEGWEELIETLNRSGDNEDAHWYVHGVTRGIRDYFHKFTMPDSGWKVHKVPSMIRPGWTDEERQEKIAMYGSRNAPSYRRNILGDPGDAEASIFVLTRLMQCVDLNEDSDYNQIEYHNKKVTTEGLIEDSVTIEQALAIPASHRELANKYQVWAGADLGMTNHPTEILVFLEIPQQGKKTLFKLISRFHLERIRAGDQVSAILHILKYYNVRGFGLDKTGLGLPIYQDLQDRAPEYLDRIKGYNFSSKILVDFDKSITVDPIRGDLVKDAGIEKNVLEESTDVLRSLVDQNRLRLPNDLDIIKEYQGQTYTNIKTGMDQYGRTRRFSTGTFHALDASRMAALAHSQHTIEEMIKVKEPEDVFDVFFVG